MKDLAILEYTFMFEPSIDTWSKGGEFEDDLTDFFAAHGLQASVVKTVGGSGRRVLCVERVDKLNKMRDGSATNPAPAKGLKQSLNAAMKKASDVTKGGK